MTTRMRRVGRRPVLLLLHASDFKEVTESGYLLSQCVGLVPGDEYQLVILDSVDHGMCCGYGDGSAALYTTAVDSYACSLRITTVCQS
jgi:hypothetical protein